MHQQKKGYVMLYWETCRWLTKACLHDKWCINFDFAKKEYTYVCAEEARRFIYYVIYHTRYAYVSRLYVIFFLGRTQKIHHISDFPKQTHLGYILITLFFFFTIQSIHTLTLFFSQWPKLVEPAQKHFGEEGVGKR